MLVYLHLFIKKLFVRNYSKVNYYYAFFLVFITPISLPLAYYTITHDLVKLSDVVLAVLLYCIGGLGISVGFHRLLSHRAFETKPWLKKILLLMGCIAMQGSPASWAGVHIQHHAHADKPFDPHSPSQHGFWHAHCGWLFKHYRPNFRRYGKWLLRDPIVRNVSQYYFYYSLIGLVVPFIVGGWVGLVWGGLLRLFISSHTTWSVTSICHLWGKRDHLVHDTSRNNFLIALLTFGEGWHNNHHRYLQSPFLSLKWYQIDMGKWFIQLLVYFGLAWNLKKQAAH